MNRRHKSYYRIRSRPEKKIGILQMKPAADGRLKKIFEEIGVPAKKPFRPDPFQLQAVSAIAHSDCLVTAPTGTGKTWIAEKAIQRIIASNARSWYACPLKALSNAKYAEFCSIFGGDHVGILTGDRKENPDASILVGTTEILRNQLYDAMHRGESLPFDLVVLDEAHFLGDPERGVVWEEIIIYLPTRIPLLLLSATIGNAPQIAGWLSSIRSKKCAVIEATKRPVPLFPLFLHPSGTLLPLTVRSKTGRNDKLYKKVNDFIKNKKTRRAGLPPTYLPYDAILRILKKYDLLPAIFFLKSRADCDRALDLCRKDSVIAPHRKAAINKMIYADAQQSPHVLNHRQLWHLKNIAVGSHHSGQLPSWKLMLEKLMTAGLLDVVFATSTVSAGVNFPARTVAFLNSDRFNGKQFLPLTPTEFHQMTGRAGRRGMDNIGFALLVPTKFMDIRLVTKLLNSPSSEVISQIRINFSMALNLLLSHRPPQIENLLKQSLAGYQIGISKKYVLKRQLDLWPDFLRHLSFLEQKGYVTSDGQLTSDGQWASQLRVDQPLMIAEGFRCGLFPETDPTLLAGIIAAFVNERESDDKAARKVMPNRLRKAFFSVTRGLKRFAGEMEAGGFEVCNLYMRPAAALAAWAGGQPWEKAVEIAELEEGDLAMLILRTADNLRHIRALVQVFPQSAQTAARAIESILREPVVYY